MQQNLRHFTKPMMTQVHEERSQRDIDLLIKLLSEAGSCQADSTPSPQSSFYAEQRVLPTEWTMELTMELFRNIFMHRFDFHTISRNMHLASLLAAKNKFQRLRTEMAAGKIADERIQLLMRAVFDFVHFYRRVDRKNIGARLADIATKTPEMSEQELRAQLCAVLARGVWGCVAACLDK